MGLSLEARSKLVLTKYGGKLHIPRNEGNLVGVDLGKQWENTGRLNPSIVFLPGLWQPTNQPINSLSGVYLTSWVCRFSFPVIMPIFSASSWSRNAQERRGFFCGWFFLGGVRGVAVRVGRGGGWVSFCVFILQNFGTLNSQWCPDLESIEVQGKYWAEKGYWNFFKPEIRFSMSLLAVICKSGREVLLLL